MKSTDFRNDNYNFINNEQNVIEFPTRYVMGANALDAADYINCKALGPSIHEDVDGVREFNGMMIGNTDIEFPDDNVVPFSRRKELLSDIFAFAGMMTAVVVIMAQILKWMMFM